MSLTDDWKERKLERAKSYWVKVQGYNLEPMVLMRDNNFIDFEHNIFDKNDNVNLCVLDKCDYEELQELKHFDGKNVCAENEILRLEIESLRDLLKECKQHLSFQKEMDNETITLLTRINTASGESEE